METATAIVTTPPCTEARDCVILANLSWLSARGYRFSASREFVVDPSGGGGFAVGLLDEAGLTGNVGCLNVDQVSNERRRTAPVSNRYVDLTITPLTWGNDDLGIPNPNEPERA